MITFFEEILEVFRKHLKGLIYLLILLLVVLFIAGGFFAYKTTQSSFCNSCHYMDPYVRHWEASSHAGVECVDCHDYGLIDLTASTVKYITNTYSGRPKADIPDENCLNGDCHDKTTLDEDKEFTRGILFHHDVHLQSELRGGKLRCTSCHNQIVQYDEELEDHMVVNDKSCFICHFKDAGLGEAITGCYSCHGIPKKEVEHAGFIFNHEPYLELEVECKQCHVQIVKGDGAVPETKCYTCHVERFREEYTERDLHQFHVTDNGIDCYKCHSDIEHRNFSMVGALDIACENCHLRQHNKPKQLYMGIGGKNTDDMPSSMFTAQVSCTGCHTHITPEGEIMAEQEKKEAGRKSCVACHGKYYDLMFDNWRAGSKKVLSEFKTFLNKAQSDYKTIGGNKKARQKIQAALTTARFNYNFVRDGHLPHNIQYGLTLLDNSANELETAMKKVNSAYVSNKPGSTKKENSCLTFCHGTAFIPEEVEYKDGTLPHELHYIDMELNCSACHSVEEHGKSKIDQSVCTDCHE